MRWKLPLLIHLYQPWYSAAQGSVFSDGGHHPSIDPSVPILLQTQHQEQPTARQQHRRFIRNDKSHFHQQHRRSTLWHFSTLSWPQGDHTIQQEENPTPWRHFDLFFSFSPSAMARQFGCMRGVQERLHLRPHLPKKTTLHHNKRRTTTQLLSEQGECKGISTTTEKSDRSQQPTSHGSTLIIKDTFPPPPCFHGRNRDLDRKTVI